MKKKINSKNLWDFINELARNEKVKFKVYCDDSYVTNILWNGENFEWESGTFTSEAFFNPLYDFEVIEEDKKIEKLDIQSVKDNPTNMYIVNEYGTKCYMTKHSREIALKLNELIDVVNEIMKG